MARSAAAVVLAWVPAAAAVAAGLPSYGVHVVTVPRYTLVHASPVNASGRYVMTVLESLRSQRTQVYLVDVATGQRRRVAGLKPAWRCVGRAVADDGTVAGDCAYATGGADSWLRDPAGVLQWLPGVGGQRQGGSVKAVSADGAHLVGVVREADGDREAGGRFRVGAAAQQVTPAGGTWVYNALFDVNEAGDACGTVARAGVHVSVAGMLKALAVPASVIDAVGCQGINAGGEMVGTGMDNRGAIVPLYWPSPEAMAAVIDLGGGAEAAASVRGMTDDGATVIGIAIGLGTRLVRWSPDDGAALVTDLIAEDDPLHGQPLQIDALSGVGAQGAVTAVGGRDGQDAVFVFMPAE